MIAMRPMVILTVAALASAAFAGCVGGDDPDVKKNAEVPDTPGGVGTGGGAVLKVLAPLRMDVESDAAAWVAAGSSYPVSASAPANAKGRVTYTWALGPAVGASDMDAPRLDTGMIMPGASKSLKYEASGTFAMHCHPHPYMKHNVTVVDGTVGPSTIHVQIVDGSSPEESRFFPENVVVARGTTIVYHNNGTQGHTSTLESGAVGLTKLPLTESSGDVTVSGDGWMRIVAIAVDSEGRVGLAEHNVYVTATLPSFESRTFSGSFNVGGAPPEIEPVQEHSFKLDHGGKLNIDITVSDAGAGLNSIVVHVLQRDATQDTMTTTAGQDTISGTVTKGDYLVRVEPKAGVKIDYSLVVTAVYDLVPPALGAPADDGHGDHGGHGGH